MDITVVIPLLNEEESLGELYSWIKKVMLDNKFDYEVIFVDDGSTDSSWQIIEELSAKDNHVKGIKFRRNYGKSAALNCSFIKAKGDVVITMDADLQDSPDEIPGLYKMIIEDDYDIVSGWKKKRHDPLGKTIPSKFFNRITRMVSGIKLHDFNCGLKAYKNTVIKSIEIYGEMHRYIPVIAKWNGFYKIGEKVVTHSERKYGVSKFGFERFVNGFLDLMSITFVSKFGKRPMHFFGTIGILIIILGGLSSIALVVKKLYYISNNIGAERITESPYFYFAITALIIGSQLFLTGFIAEMISRSTNDRNNYLIEKNIND